MTSEQPQWIPAHRETVERALQEAEQEQREMVALVSRLSDGELRAAWKTWLTRMAERLRRQRDAWERAVAEERDRR